MHNNNRLHDKDENMGISIIILSYERMDALEELLKSLLRQELEGMPIELIVCNNSPRVALSQSDSSKIGKLLNRFADVKLFNSSFNWKLKVRYPLATLAKYETILFIDDDFILLDPNFIRYMYETHKTLRPVDILSCHSRLWVEWNEKSCSAVLLNYEAPKIMELTETDVCGPGISMFNKKIAMNEAVLTMPPKFPKAVDMAFSIIAAIELGSRNYYLPSYGMLKTHEQKKQGAICANVGFYYELYALYKLLLEKGYEPVLKRLSSLGIVDDSPEWRAARTLSPQKYPWKLTEKDARVSIVIPTYNRADYIGEAIKSALAQTVQAMEIVVVDDGSTDNTAEIVANFNSNKIRYIKKEHTCAPDTRNRGINEAKGEFIIWLDSDDILMPHTHEAYQYLLSAYPDIDVAYGNLVEIDSEGNETFGYKYPDYYENNQLLMARLLAKSRLPNPATMVKKTLYDKHGGYNVDFKRAHDYEFWSRVAPYVIAKHSGVVTCMYRVHGENMSCDEMVPDRAPEIKIAKSILEQYSLNQLFPNLDWSYEQFANAQAFTMIGEVFLQYNDCELAHKYIKDSIAFFEMNAPTSEEFASAYISMGNVYLHEENYLEALEYYNKSIEMRETAREFYKLAHVHNRLGNYETAEHYYRKTLKSMSDHQAARTELDALATPLSVV
jgi:glycosyltransferase involved in cell wall biosynthesis